jgi:hypothetical protein
MKSAETSASCGIRGSLPQMLRIPMSARPAYVFRSRNQQVTGKGGVGGHSPRPGHCSVFGNGAPEKPSSAAIMRAGREGGRGGFETDVNVTPELCPFVVHSRRTAGEGGTGRRSKKICGAKENFSAAVPGANDRVRMCGYSSACGTLLRLGAGQGSAYRPPPVSSDFHRASQDRLSRPNLLRL